MRLEMGTFPVRDVLFGNATRWDAGVPGRTVRARLSSITPWSAHAVRSPCAGVSMPRSERSSS